MRLPEWLFVGYFVYVAVLSGFFHDRPQLHAQPVLYLIAAVASFLLLNRLQRGRLTTPVAIFRDWLPIVVLFEAFREMELFVPAHYDLAFEA